MTKITTFTGPDGPRVNAMLKTRACVATEAAIELTNEDHAEIDRLRALQKEDDDERVLIHAIYRAGITAGIARAEAEVAALRKRVRDVEIHADATAACMQIRAEEAERDALRRVVAAADAMRAGLHALKLSAKMQLDGARAENAALLLSANERIVALEAELFGQYKAPALSAGPLHTSVVPISTAPDCHRDEMP